MIKRTLYFSSPAYLSTRMEQMLVTLPENDSGLGEKDRSTTIPIEDIGLLVVDNPRITVTSSLLMKLLENNAAFVCCNDKHLPVGMLLNLNGNTLQSEKFRAQVDASLPLKKQLWQQTVKSKIYNQGLVLNRFGGAGDVLLEWSRKVKSGDADNMEGQAAAFYWKNLFPARLRFGRNREGAAPNQLLNYAYAILRAITARSLTGSGLLPTLGIHHRNKYNAYCLADDMMEPYRPLVDAIVADNVHAGVAYEALDPNWKREFLGIAAMDVVVKKEKSPLMVAMQRSTASLAACFEGKADNIVFPLPGW